MSIEVTIADFKTLPENVQEHPNGYYILPPDKSSNCFIRYFVGCLTLALVVVLGIAFCQDKVDQLVPVGIAIAILVIWSVYLTFSTTLIFHVEKKYIEKQTTSTISCIPTNVEIVPFDYVTTLYRRYGRVNTFRLETTNGYYLTLGGCVTPEELRVWQNWLTRIGVNAKLYDHFSPLHVAFKA